MYLMQLSKIVDLHLAAFSEKVENHWLKLCKSWRHFLNTWL